MIMLFAADTHTPHTHPQTRPHPPTPNTAGSCAAAKAPTSSFCGEGEYGDQTSPMGLNWAVNCYNLPEQHYLGWTTPSTVTLSTSLTPRIPRALAITRRSDVAASTSRRGIVLRGGPGQHAVYLDYLVRGTSGFGVMQPWLDDLVVVHSFDWDLVTFQPGYFTSKMTSLEGALVKEGDAMVLEVCC